MEKESDFVVFHASNSLSFYVIKAILYVVTAALGLSATLAGWLANIAIVGIIGAGIAGIMILIIVILAIVVEIYLFIGNILGMIKAYSYEELSMPILIIITRFIQRLKR